MINFMLDHVVYNVLLNKRLWFLLSLNIAIVYTSCCRASLFGRYHSLFGHFFTAHNEQPNHY